MKCVVDVDDCVTLAGVTVRQGFWEVLTSCVLAVGIMESRSIDGGVFIWTETDQVAAVLLVGCFDTVDQIAML